MVYCQYLLLLHLSLFFYLTHSIMLAVSEIHTKMSCTLCHMSDIGRRPACSFLFQVFRLMKCSYLKGNNDDLSCIIY